MSSLCVIFMFQLIYQVYMKKFENSYFAGHHFFFYLPYMILVSWFLIDILVLRIIKEWFRKCSLKRPPWWNCVFFIQLQDIVGCSSILHLILCRLQVQSLPWLNYGWPACMCMNSYWIKFWSAVGAVDEKVTALF